MRKKVVLYYQRLSLIQKLSIPLVVVSLFGFLLTVVIVKQVHLIQNQTVLLKDELIPALEKSTNNLTLLKNISENLTFATLVAEEDMVLEITDNQIVEINLQAIISNKKLNLIEADSYLHAFHNYFKTATGYALMVIGNDSLSSNSDEGAEKLFIEYNRVQKYFLELNHHIEREISSKTALIEETSMKVIYFTVIYIIVFSIVLFFTSYINYKDFNDYDIIEAQRKELSKVNRNLNLSIEYASLIQEAILPSNDILDGYTKDNFVFWKPKDVVGGDIYLVVELESKHEILIMVIDGVGHGVSGAFLTILVKALEAQIVEQIARGVLEPSPAEILKYFNVSIKTILKQEKGSKSNVGFDGGILYYNRRTNRCRYAGAKTPLYIINNHKLEVIKSDRKNVGFIRTKMNQEYTEYEIEIKEGTKLYISTDGLLDQEGEDNSRYGKDRFEKVILESHNNPFSQQEELITSSFLNIKGELEQSDDITVIGLEFR